MPIFKRADTSHFLEISALDRVAWKNNRNSEYIPDGEHAWRIWVEHALVFVAIEDDCVVGAILAFPCLSGEYCLHKVFVSTPYRGKGIASLLFEELFRALDKTDIACFLTVDPFNEAALQLYSNWGFCERTFVEGYYRSNENRFVLRRPPSRLD